MKTSAINRLSNLQLIGGLFLVLFLYGTPNQAAAEASPMNVSFQVFYDELTPYGDWVNDPTHGFVWIPYVDAGFQPYQTNGYWVNSRFGNTWVSLYDWGWAPFHYGRWFYTNYYGWAWVPGYEWAPAWVSWRTGQGYYGWAPLWPSIGVHVSVGFPMNHWVFVPRRRFLARNIYNYYVPQRNVTVIYNRTTVINNTYVYNNRTYIGGPSRTELQRVTRRSVPVYEVSNGTRPGRTKVENNRVQLYRPRLESTDSQRSVQSARPARAYTAEEFTSRRASTASSRSSESASNQRSNEQLSRRSATLPANTNPRSADLPSRQDRNGQAKKESTSLVVSGVRNTDRNVASTQKSLDLNDRRNDESTPNIGITSTNQRQRSVAPPSSNNRQSATSNRVSQGKVVEASRSNDRSNLAGQSQINRPVQRSSEASSPARIRIQAAPSQRQVSSPANRQSNKAPIGSSRVVTSSPNQRQIVSPTTRPQVNRGASSQSRTSSSGVRSSSSQSRSVSVQGPRQSRSSSGSVTRSTGNANRRGN